MSPVREINLNNVLFKGRDVNSNKGSPRMNTRVGALTPHKPREIILNAKTARGVQRVRRPNNIDVTQDSIMSNTVTQETMSRT
jgi:hypothetical protein